MRSKQLINEQPWRRPWWQYSEGNGAVLLYIVAIHSLALAGLVLFPLPSLRVAAMAVAVAWIGGVGTTVCYHRCLSHRALRLNRVIESILIFFTIFNASGEPMSWVANHRHHHAKADTEEDVSSPRHGGFWWAHIRWVYQWSGSEVRRWCPDMDKPRYRFWRQRSNSDHCAVNLRMARDWDGRRSSGSAPSVWYMPYIFRCSSTACFT